MRVGNLNVEGDHTKSHLGEQIFSLVCVCVCVIGLVAGTVARRLECCGAFRATAAASKSADTSCSGPHCICAQCASKISINGFNEFCEAGPRQTCAWKKKKEVKPNDPHYSKNEAGHNFLLPVVWRQQ